MNVESSLLTAAEAAVYLHVSKRTIQKWCKYRSPRQPLLRPHRFTPRVVRFRREDLDELIRQTRDPKRHPKF